MLQNTDPQKEILHPSSEGGDCQAHRHGFSTWVGQGVPNSCSSTYCRACGDSGGGGGGCGGGGGGGGGGVPTRDNQGRVGGGMLNSGVGARYVDQFPGRCG